MGQNQENLWIYCSNFLNDKDFFSIPSFCCLFFFFFAIQYYQNYGLGLKSQTLKFNVYYDGYI